MNRLLIFGMCLTVSGVLLMGFMVSWWAALALFLMVWGNNVEQHKS